jgi:hypothetical protein
MSLSLCGNMNPLLFQRINAFNTAVLTTRLETKYVVMLTTTPLVPVPQLNFLIDKLCE